MLIEWFDEDEAYVVTIPALRGCRTYGASYEEAARRGREAIDGWIADARLWGDAMLWPRGTVDG
jgi:predicted RNase H-like HicB family nuclease